MDAEAQQTECYSGSDTYIESLSYDLDLLEIIVVTESNKKIKTTFHQPIGFRCLDEGDLLEFWKNPVITNNWLLKIKSSGWYEQESQRNGFLSKNTEINEYLVKGQNDCISIFATNTPIVAMV